MADTFGIITVRALAVRSSESRELVWEMKGVRWVGWVVGFFWLLESRGNLYDRRLAKKLDLVLGQAIVATDEMSAVAPCAFYGCGCGQFGHMTPSGHVNVFLVLLKVIFLVLAVLRVLLGIIF